MGVIDNSRRTDRTGVLVTGATGYIGGRLIPRLVDRGYRVRVLVRDRERIEARPWAKDVEVCVGDLLVPSTLAKATEGMDAAYYLVHSMYSGQDYADSDRRAAMNFVQPGKNLRRVIYLGGLLSEGATRSKHLRSRAEVGRILRCELPTLEIRAGPIIGSGSASFEMVRYLTERLPIMIGPSWIENQVQPIAIRDTLSYLIHALDSDATGVLEIGGDRVSFRQMLEIYAKVRGLKRLILATKPILPPRLGAPMIGLVTGIPRSLVAPLLEGILHPVVGDTTRARSLFPQVAPLSYQVALELAFKRMRKRMVETHWNGALDRGPTYRRTEREGSNRETRSVWIKASPKRVFQEFKRLGGDHGWLTLRRNQSSVARLAPGETLGLWRVEAAEAPRLLRLRGKMRLPGETWLQLETVPEAGGTRLIQRVLFEPVGLSGAACWYAFYPIRQFVFGNLVRSLARGAEVGGNEDRFPTP